MNRYGIIGALADMRAGLRVLIVSPSRPASREAFERAAAGAWGGERVRRANGAEHIANEQGGGIWFATERSVPRGMSVDVVLLDGCLPDPVTIAPLLATRPNAEVIRL